MRFPKANRGTILSACAYTQTGLPACRQSAGKTPNCSAVPKRATRLRRWVQRRNHTYAVLPSAIARSKCCAKSPRFSHDARLPSTIVGIRRIVYRPSTTVAAGPAAATGTRKTNRPRTGKLGRARKCVPSGCVAQGDYQMEECGASSSPALRGIDWAQARQTNQIHAF